MTGLLYCVKIIKSSSRHCQEEKGGPYKASIPLGQATNPAADVLLAYEMNGEVTYLDGPYLNLHFFAI
jgi:hypothetical protein